MNSNSLGQLIMTGVPGKELEPETASLFERIQPGAFILFARNIESPLQLRKLIDDGPRKLSAGRVVREENRSDPCGARDLSATRRSKRARRRERREKNYATDEHR